MSEIAVIFRDVLFGPLGAVALIGGLVFAPLLLLGAVFSHRFGIISVGTKGTAVAAAAVLWLAWIAWMLAFLVSPLALTGADDLTLMSAAMAIVPAALAIPAITVIRRYLLTGLAVKG